ncbi:hypothetical protein [Micromonospora sp. NPDC023888]|uniref:hypothetical protein n=1 Tax=Micromonospora sp. NPDC023888 TaxID=3155607 RepID=UPI0033E005B2
MAHMQPAPRDAATTPSLDAATVLSHGEQPRSPWSALLAVGAVATVILGFDAAPSNRLPESRPPHPAAGPTAAATPSGRVASAAASPTATLEPAKRFSKRPEKPYDGAYQSDIIDKSLPSTHRGGALLRLVRDPSITTLVERVDDVAPEYLRVNGVEVRVYRTADGEGVQQAEWIHKRTFFVLLWHPQPAPHQISESDIRWMIAASIKGRF